MIKRVQLNYFKRFREEVIELADHVVLAGANNAGKTTLIQAINTWHLALKRWMAIRYKENENRRASNGANGGGGRPRTGVPITRKELTTIPLREFSLLWTDTSTALRKDELGAGQSLGTPRVLGITIDGVDAGESWSVTMEFRYANSELVYAKPSAEHLDDLPKAARDLNVVHVPPFSGIGAEETGLDRPYQELLIGQGKAGDILRNLLFELHQQRGSAGWKALVSDVEDIFGCRLLAPEYEGRPFILCEYLPGIPDGRGHGGLPRLDIASAGSGFQQVLLLLSFFYARPSAVLLLDEPDAHLHVILQKQIYDRLRQTAAARNCQLIVATHSEVILEATSPNKVVSFYGAHPHVLVSDVERDQVREALRRITALDVLLAEQAKNILYVEDETDFNLLRSWARVLRHLMAAWFQKRPFFHPIRGRNARDARAHYFALRAINPNVRGFLLLDGDNRQLPDREVGADGLTVGRWRRYEAESYLLHPAALRRFIDTRAGELFGESAIRVLEDNLPPVVLRDILGQHEILEQLAASKSLLPKLFDAAGMNFHKRDYYQLAEQMKAEEIPGEVVGMLDAIQRAFAL